VRIGLATARGLALALDLGVAGVSTLAALAAARRAMPRKVRRASGPMTVWSPDRARRR